MAVSTAALGLRAHSGWAALVAVAGTVDSPSVIDRRFIQLCNAKTPGAKQPYHAAEPLAFQDAENLVTRCIEETQKLAREGVRVVIDDLQKQGHHISGCGILLGSGRALPALDRILASHALIHAAEGQMFRDALVKSAEHCNLPVTGIKERELFSDAASRLGRSADQLREWLATLGRSLGPPWREDQKYATLAAWLALLSGSTTSRNSRAGLRPAAQTRASGPT
jgi:hypothetical protein